jgi:hypothetical protein
LRDILVIMVIQLCLFTLSSCSDDFIIEEHAEVTYTIVRRGQFTPNDYAVMHVYGFSGNEAIAQQLVDFLNIEEPNRYYQIKSE